jgi:zinc/manganese transport system substrate-binding protein
MPVITRIAVLCLALGLVAWGDTEARIENKVKIIASFSVLGDMSRNVGGDRVAVTTLVGPNGDAHVYEPTPADARAVSKAGLVVVNGLGLEGWMDRLIQTSGYQGPVVVASTGIKPREIALEEAGEHEHGAKHEHKIDPHAWQNLQNGQIYAENIAKALSAVDPEGAPISSIPKPKRRMITSHDAFGYLGAAYGVTILSPMGVSTESEPSAGGVAKLIKQIRKEKITAVFIENVSDPRLVAQIGKEGGVTLGGELFSDALSKRNGPAPTYIDMFKHNIPKIVAAMRQGL